MQNDYFFSSQYGFRKLHSTEHSVLEITDKIISEMDNANTPLAIFLDLSKAFDNLDHSVQLSKLEYYRLGQVALK